MGNLVPDTLVLNESRKELAMQPMSWSYPKSQQRFIRYPCFLLKKCVRDPLLILPTENVGINDTLSYEEIMFQILDRQVHKFRTKEVSSVKVLWRNQFVKETTWEAEEDMKKIYPHLFEFGENEDQGTRLSYQKFIRLCVSMLLLAFVVEC